MQWRFMIRLLASGEWLLYHYGKPIAHFSDRATLKHVMTWKRLFSEGKIQIHD